MIQKQEWFALLEDDSAVRALGRYSAAQLQELFGQPFAAMKGYEQNNPHHCYDLLTHTLKVVCGIEASGIPKADFEVLRTAALFHDIGKPAAAQVLSDRTVYPAHAGQSARIARELLERMGFTSPQRERILFFVENHDMFIGFYFAEEKERYEGRREINERSVYAAMQDATHRAYKAGAYIPGEYDFLLLLRLCYADCGAQSDRVVYRNWCEDSKENKQKRLEAIRSILMKKVV